MSSCVDTNAMMYSARSKVKQVRGGCALEKFTGCCGHLDRKFVISMA